MSYADHDKYGMYKTSDSAGPGPALMGADTLIGDSVVNAEGDNLGEIKEIMLDMRTGQVAYAVLSFGGFLGMGEKLFAVPWDALQLDTVNKRFVLNVDKERLKSAPGFDPDAWPDMSDVVWVREIHTFYGTDPSMSRRSVAGSAAGSGMGSSAGMGSSSGVGAGAAGMGAGSAGSSGTGAGAGSSTGMESGTGSTLGTGIGGSTGSSSGVGSSSGTDLGGSTSTGSTPRRE